MAVGYGIEGTGIEGNARHAPVLPRRRRPGKRDGFPECRQVLNRPQTCFFRPNEPVGSRPRLPGGSPLFRRRRQDETNRPRMKPISAFGEGIPKRLTVNEPRNEMTGRPKPMCKACDMGT